MLHVGVCCAVASVHCSLVVTCWERTDLLAVVFIVFCYFGPYQNQGRGWRCETSLSPPVIYFTDRSKAVLCVIYVLCLSCFRVCPLLPYGHLLTSWLLFVMFNCVFVTFPCGRFLIFAAFRAFM